MISLASSQRWFVGLLIALATALHACERGKPVAGAEAAESEPSTPPSEVRLAVLSPALVITLCELGYENRIVGRHAWDMKLPESVPIVGNNLGLDYETLLKVRPTHVVLEGSAQSLPPKLVELAGRNKWKLPRLDVLTLDQVRKSVTALDRIGQGFDPEDKEVPLSGQGAIVLSRMDEAWAQRPPGPYGKSMLLVQTDPPGALGPGSFHYQLAQRLGVDVIPQDGRPYITYTTEEALGLAPDTIVLFMPGADAARTQELLGPLAKLNIPAVRNGRVIVVNHEQCLTPSTAMIPVAEDLRAKLDALPAR